MGQYESPITLLAREAHERAFFNLAGYADAGAFDEALLGPLDQVLQRSDEKQLIVLHTMGSHFNYRHRYPASFDVFRPSFSHSVSVDFHDRAIAEELNNAYDNSILYTDYVVSRVIEAVARSQRVAGVIYVADHGENIFDRACDLTGHGIASPESFEVAAFVWYSTAYASQYPGKVLALKQNAALRLSTNNISPSLLEMADIGYPGDKSMLSIFSDRFREERRLVHAIGGLADYDLSKRVGACQLVVGAVACDLGQGVS
jgi:glucan phosphoethanolaminetransferase (alkaline phosphatase superfamily)